MWRSIALSSKVLVVLVSCYALLFLCSFAPLFGILITLTFRIIGYLWVYTGVPVAVVASVCGLLVPRTPCALRRRLARGMKSGAITFLGYGLLLCPSFLVVPGAEVFTAGYCIHAKVWLDVSQIREFIEEPGVGPQEYGGIPREKWPPTLRRFSDHGRLILDPASKSLTLVNGGGFGHWGVHIAPGDSAPPVYWIVLKFGPGAWVWHDFG